MGIFRFNKGDLFSWILISLLFPFAFSLVFSFSNFVVQPTAIATIFEVTAKLAFFSLLLKLFLPAVFFVLVCFFHIIIVFFFLVLLRIIGDVFQLRLCQSIFVFCLRLFRQCVGEPSFLYHHTLDVTDLFLLVIFFSIRHLASFIFSTFLIQ